MKKGRRNTSDRNQKQRIDSTRDVIHQAIDTLAPVGGEKPPLLISSLRSLFEGEVPNLFDWYIGMVSILLGCSMFLFNRYLTSDAIAPYLIWLIPIRISFIAAGTGALMLGFFQKNTVGQGRSVHILLSMTYLLFALILWQTGQWDSSVLYALTGVAIVLTITLGTGGVIGFFVYSLLLLALLPISLAAGNPGSPTSSLLHMLRIPLPVGSALWLAIVGSITLGTLGSYRRHPGVFRISLSLIILGHLSLSFWYGTNMAWGSSLLLALLSAMMLLVPHWRFFPFEQRWTKIALSGTCMGVFLILSFGLFLVHTMQRTMVDQAETHLMHTATYGGVMLSSSFDNIKAAMESTSKNPALHQAITDNNNPLLQGLSRSLFESNRILLRVGFLDTDGRTLAAYPPSDNGLASFPPEELAVQALRDNTVLYPITNTDGSIKTPVIAISTPIRSSENGTLGMTVSMIDLYALTDMLQQITASENEEFITVTDTSGRRIVHPDIDLIGTIAQAADNAQDVTSVVQGFTHNGIRVMQAERVVPLLSMRVVVKQPMATIIPVNTMLLFLAVCTVIMYLMIISMNMYIYVRREVLSEQDKPKIIAEQNARMQLPISGG